MKHLSALLILFFFIIAKAHSQFSYLNPPPNSSHNYPQVTLTIKNGDLIDESSLNKTEFIEIMGTLSGRHSYTARLSDDGKTIVVHPQPVFDYGETVSVTIHSDQLKKKSGQLIRGTSYSFHIRDAITPEQAQRYRQAYHEFDLDGYDPGEQADLREVDIDSLPPYAILTNNNAAPGQIFFRNRAAFDEHDTNCIATIMENNGSVTWARDMGENGADFKINHNGCITYFNNKFGDDDKAWMVLDSNYNVIDSFQCGNGFGPSTNSHDMTMYPDGHALLIAYDTRTMDMTPYGGQPEADVTQVRIQELDAENDVIWEWSGWDHINVTDAISTVPLTNAMVDVVHANAVSRDYDGNIILSGRHLSEVSKINRETGDFIWRLNGENNQFTFMNDNIPEHFSRQHDAYRLDNGNIMLYNNGVGLSPLKSSSKEYQIDEVNKIATLKWYYEHPDINGNKVYGPATGSSQRLPNGNTLIDWGNPAPVDYGRPISTEVDSNKNIVWEMRFDEYQQSCYRVHKYVWNPCEMPKPGQIAVTKITDTSAKVTWAPVNNAVTYDFQFRKVGNNNWRLKNLSDTHRKLKNLKAGKTYEFQVRTNCLNGYTSDWTPLGTFTTQPQRTTVKNEMSSCSLYPNPTSGSLNFRFNSESEAVSISIFDLTGKVFLTSNFDLLEGELLTQLDVSFLPVGFYFIKAKTTTEEIIQKFVKQ